jgi:polyhydroxyalkanoate synthase
MAAPTDTAPNPPASDPQEIAKSFAQIAEQSQKIVNEFIERQRDGKAPAVSDDLGLANAFMDLATSLIANPWKLAEAQMQMWNDYLRLWQGGMQRFLGEQPAPVAEPAKSDNRFNSELWQNNFLFDYIKQSYLIASQNI